MKIVTPVRLLNFKSVLWLFNICLIAVRKDGVFFFFFLPDFFFFIFIWGGMEVEGGGEGLVYKLYIVHIPAIKSVNTRKIFGCIQVVRVL